MGIMGLRAEATPDMVGDCHGGRRPPSS